MARASAKPMMMAKKEDDEQSKSETTKRSLKVRGLDTSVRLEDALWKERRAMADERDVSLSELVNHEPATLP